MRHRVKGSCLCEAASESGIALRKGQIAGRLEAQPKSSDDDIDLPVIHRGVRCITASRDLIFAKRLFIEAEVALTCQKSRYLDARTYNAVRGMTIFFLRRSALRAMTIIFSDARTHCASSEGCFYSIDNALSVYSFIVSALLRSLACSLASSFGVIT